MPIRQIEAVYTRSELTIMAWRSQETASNMSSQRQQRGTASPDANGGGYTRDDLADIVSTRQAELLEQKLGPLVYKLENEAGDVDLRRLTGDEAVHFMQTMGLPMGRSVESL